MTTCSKYPATCPLPGTHSLFLQVSRGNRHLSAITWESLYPTIVPLFHTLSLTLSFHVELLLSLSSCYLWSTDSSEEMTQNSDPRLPAAAGSWCGQSRQRRPGSRPRGAGGRASLHCAAPTPRCDGAAPGQLVRVRARPGCRTLILVLRMQVAAALPS